MIFGAIALLVGVIIISTTFGILLAQRRRQIGLMRAVGASGGYVRRMVLGEAIVLGVLGSLLGIVLGLMMAGYTAEAAREAVAAGARTTDSHAVCLASRIRGIRTTI